MTAIATGWPEPLVYDETEDMAGGYGRAVFNEARTHRYLLERRWGPGPLLVWQMLNPSEANAFITDPTVSRCIKFARREGYGGIRILNVYGFKSPHPAALATADDPIGASNDQAIAQWAHGTVVAAWGSHPFAAARARQVYGMLADAGATVLCLGTTRDGSPIHPLARGRSRVPDDAPFIAYRRADA